MRSVHTAGSTSATTQCTPIVNALTDLPRYRSSKSPLPLQDGYQNLQNSQTAPALANPSSEIRLWIPKFRLNSFEFPPTLPFQFFLGASYGWVTERSIVHAWKACVPKGTGGSNPPPSAILIRDLPDRARISLADFTDADVTERQTRSHFKEGRGGSIATAISSASIGTELQRYSGK